MNPMRVKVEPFGTSSIKRMKQDSQLLILSWYSKMVEHVSIHIVHNLDIHKEESISITITHEDEETDEI